MPSLLHIFFPCIVYVVVVFAHEKSNSNYIRSLHCRKDESSVISKLYLDMRSSTANLSCSNQSWLVSMRDWGVEHGRSSGVFVNIGFKKGNSFAIWMNLLFSQSFMTPKEWHEGLLKIMTNDNKEPCGPCDCETVDASKSLSDGKNVSSFEFVFVGMDIDRRNIDLVSAVVGCSHSGSLLQGDGVIIGLLIKSYECVVCNRLHDTYV